MQSKPSLSFITALVILVCVFASQPPVFACATCGCSEVCPLTVMDGTADRDSSLLLNSIWGNIILKMTYARDPEVLRLAGKLRITNLGSTAGLVGVAGGTMAQGVVSMATLNPPDGLPDSYAPGIVGLGLEAAVLMIFAGGPLVQHKFRKQLKARQVVIRQQVEQILEHLEYSKTDCSQAQNDLTALVGNRGAQECIQLWQSSHRLATTTQPKISAIGKTEPQQ